MIKLNEINLLLDILSSCATDFSAFINSISCWFLSMIKSDKRGNLVLSVVKLKASDEWKHDRTMDVDKAWIKSWFFVLAINAFNLIYMN
jgi:hypothetical protein